MIYILILLAAWFGFANPVLQLPFLVLVWPAGLFYLGCKAETLSRAFKKGWLAGALVYSACLYWISYPVQEFTALPWILSLPVPVLLGVYLGLFSALFCLAVSWSQTRLSWFSHGIFSALTWVCLEYLRSTLFTGFPWLSLPQALAPWPWSLQLLPLVGSFFLAGLMVLFSSWLILGVRQKMAWLGSVILLFLCLGLPNLLDFTQTTDSELIKVSLIQGNIDQNQKWDPEYQKMTVQVYKDLSRQALQEQDSLLLVWPETALPFYLQEPSELQETVKGFVSEESVYLIAGAPGYRYIDQTKYHLYNRAYLLHPEGQIAGHYDKERLVPFGEYVPLQDLLPIKRLVSAAQDFSPGQETKPLNIQNLALGLLICYEIIFPDLVQKRIQQGANMLLNISNDAWFGRTSAPRQHLHQAVLRALEQNRWVLRATNTGISAIISPQGNIQSTSTLFQAEIINSAQCAMIPKQTIFSRHYQNLKHAAWIGFILLFVLALFKSKRPKAHLFYNNQKEWAQKLNQTRTGI